MQGQWDHKIFTIEPGELVPAALELFHYQYANNPLYREYADALHIKVPHVQSIEEIPFLPISVFKTHEVKTGLIDTPVVFESSGTTGMLPSRHYVKDSSLYESSFLEGFRLFYGDLQQFCVIGLLPSYLERKNSSLVYMVNEWIRQSKHPKSGFYLNEFDKLSDVLKELEDSAQQTILIGVGFALLDFAQQFSFPLNHTIIMETGGMKGRRQEMLREELHNHLKNAFKVSHIHSEYGMTELLSQAYSKGGGIFHCPPWMKVLIRDEDDPQVVHSTTSDHSITGAINIIDLANIHSCSFIATDDAGRLHPDGSFEVLGRLDNSDVRGCSLLVAQ